MGIHVANLDHMVVEVAANAVLPPPLVDYLQWAVENVVFSERESPLPGPYNPLLFPEFSEILRAMGADDPCRVVTVKKSAQLGGTILANIFTLGSTALSRGDFLYVHPTDDNARRWSKMKLSPMMRNIPAIARLFSHRSRDGSDSVLYKERSDGLGAIQISGANSPASLSQVSMPRQVQDDLSKWDMNDAGDPETQADSRSRAFEFAKILKISTPLVLPGCRITASYNAGSQERCYVPCSDCDAFQVLEWSNMLATIEANAEDPHFTCVECGCEIREHQLKAMKTRLEWRAANPAAKRHHRSFWIWSAYSALQSWARIAQEWLKAKGDPAKERVFLNDTCGLEYQADSESPPWEELRDRASLGDTPVGVIPPGYWVLTIGVDCQGDRVEYQVVAFGRLGRHIVDYGVFPGHISDDRTRALLDGLLKQTWKTSLGLPIPADMLGIDGNAWTEDVWAWAKRHPSSRVIMVRGSPQDNAPLLARVKRERNEKTGKQLRYSRRFYNFGASVMKMALYRNLAKTDPLERGFISLPRGLEDEFFRQLTAERRRAKQNKQGFTVHQWVKDAGQANEGLDTHLQAEAAAIRFGVRSFPDAIWDGLEADRGAAPPEQQFDLEDLMNRPSAPPQPPPPAAEAAAPATGRPKQALPAWAEALAAHNAQSGGRE